MRHTMPYYMLAAFFVVAPHRVREAIDWIAESRKQRKGEWK
jgi:hypothetical protein